MSFDGDKLKQARIVAKVSVKEISALLISKGQKASPNTIYSWENGNSQPTPDALLTMCEKYNIADPLAYFGYTNTPDSYDLTHKDIEIAIAYHKADKTAREIVDLALKPYLDKEIEREELETAIG